MKKIILITAIFWSIFGVFSQNDNKIVIACTYDYRQALSTRKSVAGDNDSLIRYAVLISDTIYEKPNFSIAIKDAFTTKKNLFLYIHGDGTNIDAAIKRGKDFANLYNVNVILFAWPSLKIHGTSIKNYKISKRNTDLCFNRFVQLTDSIQNYINEEKVEVFAFFHSLGNKYAKDYANYLASNENLQSPFSDIILNAASVPAQNHAIWVEELSKRVKNKVFIVFNEKDKILKLATSFIEKYPLLGRNPGRDRTPTAFYINATETLIEVNKGTKKNRNSLSHNYFFLRSPNLKSVYDSLINNKIPAFSNRNVIVSTFGYDIRTQKKDTVENLYSRYLLSDWYAVSESSSLSIMPGFSSAMNNTLRSKNILIYIHGNDEPVNELIQDISTLSDIYNVSVVAFAWPSKEAGEDMIANFKTSERNIDSCFDLFVNFLDSVSAYYERHSDVKISLLFHSLGNAYARKSINALETVFKDKKLPVENLILNAACVPTANHTVWVDALCEKIAGQLFIMFNEKDMVLSAARFIMHEALLGENPTHDRISEHAIYVNLTKSIDKYYPHNYFIGKAPLINPAVKTTYQKIFNSELPDFSNQEYYQKQDYGYSVNKIVNEDK